MSWVEVGSQSKETHINVSRLSTRFRQIGWPVVLVLMLVAAELDLVLKWPNDLLNENGKLVISYAKREISRKCDFGVRLGIKCQSMPV